MEFKQLLEIKEGFFNLFKSKLRLSNSDIEGIAKSRMEICIACDFRNKVKNTCKECGCYLPSKTRSMLSNCPNYFWDEI